MRLSTALLTFLITGPACAAAAAQPAGMVNFPLSSHPSSKAFHPKPHDVTNGKAHSRFGIYGIDSVPNFNGQFFADGFDSGANANRHWYVNTVGNPPQMGGTTSIDAPIQPVNVELDDAAGNPIYFNGKLLISTASQLVAPALNSPVFANATYSSSASPTQFSDAIQRAQFYQQAKPDWHTLLAPKALPAVSIHLQQSAGCAGPPAFAGCNYLFALNPDGTCCDLILVNDANGIFAAALAGVAAADIGSSSITTKSISTFLFNNVYLYFDTFPDTCCVLGYHTYFFEPGSDPEMRWVINYSSWVSTTLFGPIAQDVTVLSHEIAETYNDPFLVSDGVHNMTPFWVAPNGDCGDVVESGDPLEDMASALSPITLGGVTYHPQSQALLQWFKFESPSSALGGAYSYPNTALLTSVSPPQKFVCAQ